MVDLTILEIDERRQRIETEAALLLGRMQFEFSRLDTALGLCAVWVDDGANLKELTPRIEAMTFHKKLEFVEAAVERRVRKGSPSYKNYRAWIDQVQAARAHRNELVHGRWYIDPISQEAVNIVGLPTSKTQREKRYTLSQLEADLGELRSLQQALSKLRRQKAL